MPTIAARKITAAAAADAGCRHLHLRRRRLAVMPSSATSVMTIVGFTVSSGPVLKETFRVHDAGRRLLSAPMTLPDGHTLVGAGDGSIIFGGPNANKLAPVNGPGAIYGAPTRTVNGSVAAVGASGLAMLRDGKIVSQASLPPSYHVGCGVADACLRLDNRRPHHLRRGRAEAVAEVRLGRGRHIAAGDRTGRPGLRDRLRHPVHVSPAAAGLKPLPRAPGAILQKDPGGQ